MASTGLDWFRPMWRRVAIVSLVVLWCGYEWFISKDQFWGVVTLAMLAWSIWTFFISYDKNVGPPKDGAPPPPAGPPAA